MTVRQSSGTTVSVTRSPANQVVPVFHGHTIGSDVDGDRTQDRCALGTRRCSGEHRVGGLGRQPGPGAGVVRNSLRCQRGGDRVGLATDATGKSGRRWAGKTDRKKAMGDSVGQRHAFADMDRRARARCSASASRCVGRRGFRAAGSGARRPGPRRRGSGESARGGPADTRSGAPRQRPRRRAAHGPDPCRPDRPARGARCGGSRRSGRPVPPRSAGGRRAGNGPAAISSTGSRRWRSRAGCAAADSCHQNFTLW